MQPPEKAAGLAWSSFAVVMLLGLVAAGGNAEGVFLFAPEGVFLPCSVLVVCVCLVAIVLVESLARESVVATYRHRRTGVRDFVCIVVFLMVMLHLTCVQGADGSSEDEGGGRRREEARWAHTTRGRHGETPGSPGFMPDRSDTPNGDTSEDEGAAGARQRRSLTPGYPPGSPPELAPRDGWRAGTPPVIPAEVAVHRRAMTPEYDPISSPPSLAAVISSGWGGGGGLTHTIRMNADDDEDLCRAIENSMPDAPPLCSLSAGGAHSAENYRVASAAASADASAAASVSVNLPARAAPRGRGSEESFSSSKRRRASGREPQAAAAGPRVQGNMAAVAQKRDAARKLREFRQAQAGASMETDQDMTSVQAELRRANEKLHEAHQKLEEEKKKQEQASASKKPRKYQKQDAALEEKVAKLQDQQKKADDEKKTADDEKKKADEAAAKKAAYEAHIQKVVKKTEDDERERQTKNAYEAHINKQANRTSAIARDECKLRNRLLFERHVYDNIADQNPDEHDLALEQHHDGTPPHAPDHDAISMQDTIFARQQKAAWEASVAERAAAAKTAAEAEELEKQRTAAAAAATRPAGRQSRRRVRHPSLGSASAARDAEAGVDDVPREVHNATDTNTGQDHGPFNATDPGTHYVTSGPLADESAAKARTNAAELVRCCFCMQNIVDLDLIDRDVMGECAINPATQNSGRSLGFLNASWEDRVETVNNEGATTITFPQACAVEIPVSVDACLAEMGQEFCEQRRLTGMPSMPGASDARRADAIRAITLKLKALKLWLERIKRDATEPSTRAGQDALRWHNRHSMPACDKGHKFCDPCAFKHYLHKNLQKFPLETKKPPCRVRGCAGTIPVRRDPDGVGGTLDLGSIISTYAEPDNPWTVALPFGNLHAMRNFVPRSNPAQVLEGVDRLVADASEMPIVNHQRCRNEILHLARSMKCPVCLIIYPPVLACTHAKCACGAHFCNVCGRLHADSRRHVESHMMSIDVQAAGPSGYAQGNLIRHAHQLCCFAPSMMVSIMDPWQEFVVMLRMVDHQGPRVGPYQRRKNIHTTQDSDRSSIMNARDEDFFYAYTRLHTLHAEVSNSHPGFPGNNAGSRSSSGWRQDENEFRTRRITSTEMREGRAVGVRGPHWGDTRQNRFVSDRNPECRSLHNTIKNNWAVLFPGGLVWTAANQDTLWDLHCDEFVNIHHPEYSHTIYAGHIQATIYYAQLHRFRSVVAVHRYGAAATTLGPHYWQLWPGVFEENGVASVPAQDQCKDDRECYSRLDSQHRQTMVAGWSLTNSRMRENIQQLYDALAMQFGRDGANAEWDNLRDVIEISLRQRMYMECNIPFAVHARMQVSDARNRLGQTGMFFWPIPVLIDQRGARGAIQNPRLDWLPYVEGVRYLESRNPPFQFAADNLGEPGSLQSDGTRARNILNGWTRTGDRQIMIEGVSRTVPVGSLAGAPHEMYPYGQVAPYDFDDDFSREGLDYCPKGPSEAEKFVSDAAYFASMYDQSASRAWQRSGSGRIIEHGPGHRDAWLVYMGGWIQSLTFHNLYTTNFNNLWGVGHHLHRNRHGRAPGWSPWETSQYPSRLPSTEHYIGPSRYVNWADGEPRGSQPSYRPQPTFVGSGRAAGGAAEGAAGGGASAPADDSPAARRAAALHNIARGAPAPAAARAQGGDAALADALRASMAERQDMDSDDDPELARVIALSRQDVQMGQGGDGGMVDDDDDPNAAGAPARPRRPGARVPFYRE